jgi:hypothetical protein
MAILQAGGAQRNADIAAIWFAGFDGSSRELPYLDLPLIGRSSH